MTLKIPLAFVLVTLGATAHASSETWAHPKAICSDCFPAQGVVFKLDEGTSECPRGSWIYFNPGGDINKLRATYAAILATYLGQGYVWVHFAGSCTADAARPSMPGY